MKPSEIKIGKQYRNSRYPSTVYLGVIGPDAEPSLQIVKSENEEMKNRIVKWDEKEPMITDFWMLFNSSVPVDISSPPSIPTENSIGENNQEPPEEPKPRKPKTERNLVFPNGEFSVKDLAAHNNVEYITASNWMKEQEANGVVERTRTERRAPKGPGTQLFKVKS